MKNSSLSLIYWTDAAYSFDTAVPSKEPLTTVTCGFIVEKTERYIHIATNIKDDDQEIIPVDGFLIPNEAIIKIIPLYL